MGWLSRLFRSRPEQRAVTFQDAWGSGRDHLPSRTKTIDTALTSIPVYAATRLLSDSVASLPIHVYRKSGDQRQRIDTPQLFQDPSVFGTSYDWVFRAMSSLTLRGNAYGLVTAWTNQGFPASVEWLNPEDVNPDEDSTTVRPLWYWKGRTLDSSTLIHIPNYVLPGRMVGLSPIAAYAVTTQTGLLAEQFGRDWFENGSIPSAVLQSDQEITQDQAITMKARFREASRAREPVALGAGLHYQPITVNPDESQFLETMRATRNDIAAIYGIPPERIGGAAGGGSLTYGNREQDSIDLVTWTLRSYLTRLEAAFSQMLPGKQFVRFNVDALVRADLKTRYEAHTMALASGWMSRDEVRAIEDMPPLPNGEGAKYSVMPARRTPPQNEEQTDE